MQTINESDFLNLSFEVVSVALEEVSLKFDKAYKADYANKMDLEIKGLIQLECDKPEINMFIFWEVLSCYEKKSGYIIQPVFSAKNPKISYKNELFLIDEDDNPLCEQAIINVYRKLLKKVDLENYVEEMLPGVGFKLNLSSGLKITLNDKFPLCSES